VFSSVLLWTVLRRHGSGNAPAEPLTGVIGAVLLLMRVSAVGIVVFGVVRLLAYRAYEWNEAAGSGQVYLLAGKHVLFAAVFAAGLVCYARAWRLMKKTP